MSTVMLNKFSSAEESVRNAWGLPELLWEPVQELHQHCFSCFFFCILGKSKEYQKETGKRDTHSRDEATGEVMKNIVLIVMPIILSSFIYNVNGFINSYMYSGIQGFKGN